MWKGRAIEEAKRRCRALQNRIENLKNLSSSSLSCKSTLVRLVQSELSFLNRLSHDNNLTDPTSPLSVNIGHLEAVVHILEQPTITGVSRVCKPIPTSFSEKQVIFPSSSIHVDIICSLNGIPVWFIVSARNSKYISWHGSSGNKGLKMRIEQLLNAAKSCTSLKPSSIIVFFSNGLDDSSSNKLREEFGATDLEMDFCYRDFDCNFVEEELEDEWVDVLMRSYEKACLLEMKVGYSADEIPTTVDSTTKIKPEDLSLPVNDIVVNLGLNNSFISILYAMKCCSLDGGTRPSELVNFDTTALIAIVSGISNGGTEKLLATPESELRSRFKGNYDFVMAQVNSEIQNPIHVELAGALCGKRGIICESVYSEFNELVSMYSGPNEKFRADHFLKHLNVVPDCPSMRLKNLPTTRKLALKNKVVFGTGDYWHAPTFTSNMAFVRAVSQTGLSLSTLEHKPRALESLITEKTPAPSSAIAAVFDVILVRPMEILGEIAISGW